MQNKTQIEKVKAGIKASAVILPLLGITWLFGLLAFNFETITFKYIFAIANSLQGLLIFIFHCLLNKQVRTEIEKFLRMSLFLFRLSVVSFFLYLRSRGICFWLKLLAVFLFAIYEQCLL